MDQNLVIPVTQTIIKGQPAIFYCNAEVVVGWFHNGNHISQEIAVGRMLYIRKVKVKDGGIYTCNTNNRAQGTNTGILGVYGKLC